MSDAIEPTGELTPAEPSEDNLLDAAGIQNLFNHINDMWVFPEIKRRREAGTLSENFLVRRCLVKLPKGEAAIVEFNDEVGWNTLIKKPETLPMVKGDAVFIHQVESVLGVAPPSHGGVQVACVFLYWTGVTWRILFDFRPNHEGFVPDNEDNWRYSQVVADYLNLVLREMVIRNHDTTQANVDRIALWPAQALVPYPFSAICELCRNGQFAEARTALVSHCDDVFLTKLVSGWTNVPAFVDRSSLFEPALQAHIARQYTLSVSALLPQVEGVITDWIISQTPTEKIPWSQESKTKRFRELVRAGAQRTYSDDRIAESVINFILDGPVLATFKDWLSPVADPFPNRHMVGHGKFTVDLYSQENSIKAFLMLDTLYRIMAAAT
jgi:hypothetical protein